MKARKIQKKLRRKRVPRNEIVLVTRRRISSYSIIASYVAEARLTESIIEIYYQSNERRKGLKES